jgi:hypothetical protein
MDGAVVDRKHLVPGLPDEDMSLARFHQNRVRETLTDLRCMIEVDRCQGPGCSHTDPQPYPFTP